MNACRECGSSDIEMIDDPDLWRFGCQDCYRPGPVADTPVAAAAAWDADNPLRESIAPAVASKINIDALATRVADAIRWIGVEGERPKGDYRRAAREAIEAYLDELKEETDS